MTSLLIEPHVCSLLLFALQQTKNVTTGIVNLMYLFLSIKFLLSCLSYWFIYVMYFLIPYHFLPSIVHHPLSAICLPHLPSAIRFWILQSLLIQIIDRLVSNLLGNNRYISIISYVILTYVCFVFQDRPHDVLKGPL